MKKDFKYSKLLTAHIKVEFLFPTQYYKYKLYIMGDRGYSTEFNPPNTDSIRTKSALQGVRRKRSTKRRGKKPYIKLKN